jgi:hypothetical protein
MFTAVSNVSGLVKESAYLTDLSPGVDWISLTGYGTKNVTLVWGRWICTK